MITNSVQKDSLLILIVDDDKSMRMLLRLALEQEGYQVLEAQDGNGCLAAYQHHQPNIILLDAVMPGMDGFNCCAQLRTNFNSKVPILMLTVLDEPDAVEQAFTVGATDYITKPIHWTVLRYRLRRLIAQSHLLQQLEQARQDLARLAALVAHYEATNSQQIRTHDLCKE